MYAKKIGIIQINQYKKFNRPIFIRRNLSLLNIKGDGLTEIPNEIAFDHLKVNGKNW